MLCDSIITILCHSMYSFSNSLVACKPSRSDLVLPVNIDYTMSHYTIVWYKSWPPSHRRRGPDQGLHHLINVIAVLCVLTCFAVDSEEYVWSGWNSLRGALEVGGLWLQGAYPSRGLKLTYPKPVQSGIQTSNLQHLRADP